MIRTVFYLLISIFLLTLLRYVIGTITRGFADLIRPKRTPGGASGPNRAERVGELKKDPVCGTFVDASASVKQTVGGQVVHFCSTACRDKYLGLTS
jgi:YHS domain-containing protein